jgi:hypothetical protein
MGKRSKIAAPFEGGNMTIQSVLRLIGRFLHALCTVVGAFFLLYLIAEVILRYSAGTDNPLSPARLLIPCLIFAAVYTWLERPKKPLHEKG